MEKQKQTRPRLVYRPSSLAVKCIVLAAILLCSVALTIIGVSIKTNQRKAEEARAHAAEQEQQNALQEQKNNELGTPQSTQRIAYEELGLVDPDTVIFETTE